MAVLLSVSSGVGRAVPELTLLCMDAREAYIGLGSNLPGPGGAPPEATLRAAVRALGKLGSLETGSGLWRTAPVGPVLDQPAFVNGAVRVRTSLEPRELLLGLHEIERRFGRVRGVDKGPRTLDLDLLLLGPECVVDEPGLRVPHPEMHRRRFVLAPLAEFAPGVVHPVLGRTVEDLLREAPGSVERIAGPGLLAGQLLQPALTRRI